MVTALEGPNPRGKPVNWRLYAGKSRKRA